MEHVFIINPAAGKADASADLVPRIRAAGQALGIDPVIELTDAPGHARAIAERYSAAGAPARLYACGGDGTLNEVLQAVVGQPQLALGCVPCGSGNDYVRNFGPAEPFLDMKAQLTAQPVTLDVLHTTYGDGAAICAAGLDAQVAYAIPRYRHLAGGTLSYTCAIVETLFRHIGHRLRITLEGPGGTTILSDEYTLLAVCNGQQYGGGYCAAPQARMDDGLLDVLLVGRIHRPALLGILGGYKKGEHIAPDGTVAPRYRKYMRVLRATGVHIDVLDGRPLIVTLDGECTPCTTSLDIRVLPGQLSALVPTALLQGGAMPALARPAAAVH